MEQWEIKAFQFAQDAHIRQKDKEDRDYFTNHVIHVVNILKMAIRDYESFTIEYYRRMITAAYLHDTLEDCYGKAFGVPVAPNKVVPVKVCEDTIKEHFGEDVLNLVLEVTHTKSQVFPRLKTLDGFILKFADRLANLS